MKKDDPRRVYRTSETPPELRKWMLAALEQQIEELEKKGITDEEEAKEEKPTSTRRVYRPGEEPPEIAAILDEAYRQTVGKDE